MDLFSLSATLLLPPACITPSDNEGISSLIPAGLIAQCRFAPRCLRLTTNRMTTFATSMRMVSRVHDRTTYGRTAAHMTRTPGFTKVYIFMVSVANLADSCHTEDVHTALLARWQANLCIIALFRHQLCTCSGPSYHLTTPATLQ